MKQFDRRGAFALAIDVVMASLMALLAVAAFQQSFGGTRYLIAGSCGIAIGIVFSLLGEVRSWPTLVVVAAVFAGYVIVGGVVALPDRAVAGFLPSAATTATALRQLTGGWKQLLTTVPPVSGVGGLLNLPVIGGAFASTGALVVARRLRWLGLSIAFPFAVLVLGLLCGFHQPVSVMLHGAVFVVIALLWWSLRARHSRVIEYRGRSRIGRQLAALVMLGVAGTFGVVVGPSIASVDASNRLVLRDRVNPPFDPADYPSPLSAHRRYVKEVGTQELFTLSGVGLPSNLFIRRATMDQYDGVIWKLSAGTTASVGASGFFQRVGSDVNPNAVGPRYRVTVSISRWSEVWVPTLGDLVSISFDGPRANVLRDAFRYNRLTGTAALQGTKLRAGDRYTMVVTLSNQGMPPLGARIEQQPSDIAKLGGADKLLAWLNRASRVERSKKPFELAAELKKVGLYSDGNSNQQPAIGGHGLTRLQDFIEGTGDQPVGDAEQYAAGLAVMLNLDGIGARVVAGFSVRQDPKLGSVSVRGDSATAWTETPYVGLGWYRQDPTPRTDQVSPTPNQPPPPQPERNVQVPPPPPLLTEDPRTEPATATKSDRAAADQKQVRNLTNTQQTRSATLFVVAVGGAPIAAALTSVSLVAFWKIVRRNRRRRRGTPITRILNGWREFTDALRDLGMPVAINSTRREVASLVRVGDAAELAKHADFAVFGPDTQSDNDASLFWGALEFELRRLRRELGFTGRLKLLINVTSLRSGGSE